MRYFTTSLLFAVLSLLCASAAPFQNLNFENPHLPIQEVGFLEGLAVDAIPGWKPAIRSFEQDRILLNTFPVGSARIALFGPLAEQPNPQRNLYSVRLYPGLLNGPDASSRSSVSISQMGDISGSAKSLRLDARIFGEYHVTLDGIPIAMTLALTGTSYDTYYGDIRSFAGRTADLKIETGKDLSGAIFIEKISFSTLVVPEPSTYALLAFGLFGLGWGALRRHQI